LQVFSGHFESGSRFVEFSRTLLGVAMREQGKADAGIRHIREAIDNLSAFYGKDHQLTEFAHSRLRKPSP
jgi:delta 1-pyrroline-5-carboxylate dehydrogenase